MRGHNLFSTFSLPGVKGLSALSRAATDPEAAAQLAQRPEFKALTQDPRVRSLLNDPSIRNSLQSGDYLSLLRNNRVFSALSDPGLEEKLKGVANLSDDAPGPTPTGSPRLP